MLGAAIGCRASQTCRGSNDRDCTKVIADTHFSIFESILNPIRKSLSSGNNADSTVEPDCVEYCNDLLEVLNHLVATQSEEQWLSFSQPPGHNYYRRPSSNTKGPRL